MLTFANFLKFQTFKMAALLVKSRLSDKRFKNIQSCDEKQIVDKTVMVLHLRWNIFG